MTQTKASMEEKIKSQGFDTQSAQRYAKEGRLEEWAHTYLTTASWANPGFRDGLRLKKRWWNGPVAIELRALSRAVGPEPGMEYRVDDD